MRLRAEPTNVRSWESTGRNAHVVFGPFMTQGGQRLLRNAAVQYVFRSAIFRFAAREKLLVKRRDFITLLGGAAAWPLAARAQQSLSTIPVIGFVYPGVPELSAGVVAAFRKGLNETGFVEGRNVTVEFRFAYNDNGRLSELAGDLVQRGVAVIATPASRPAALAAKAATNTVPIVFGVGADPVEIGLVASLNHPGGNATGITSMNAELGPKRLGLLHELLPGAVRFAVLLNPNNRNTDALTRDLQAGFQSPCSAWHG
jgi:putative tryptophan/tyrosine transport system substrate-binding protein